MSFFEKIEKTVLVRKIGTLSVIFVVIGILLSVAGLTTVYHSLDNSKDKSIYVSEEEVSQLLRLKDASKIAVKEGDISDVLDNKALAKKIAEKVMFTTGIGIKDTGYDKALITNTSAILEYVSDYNEKRANDALTQLLEYSSHFTKEDVSKQIDVFFSLYGQKYKYDKELSAQKSASKEFNIMMGLASFVSGIVVFALFVIILLLMKIEKNRSNVIVENDDLVSNEKSGAISFLIIIVLLSGLVIAVMSYLLKGNEDTFTPVIGTQIISEEATQNVAVEENSQPEGELQEGNDAMTTEDSAESDQTQTNTEQTAF